MSEAYAGNPSNNPSAITIPDDSDPKPVASVNAALEGLMDKAVHMNLPEQDATKRYPLASRTVNRLLRNARPEDTWVPIAAGSWSQGITTPSRALVFPIEIPDGATLQSVTFSVKGGTGHSALPLNPVNFGLNKFDVAAGTLTTLVAPTPDPSPDVASYEAIHTVVLTPASPETIDNAGHLYTAVAYSEGNTNSQPNYHINGVFVTFTMTALDEGAS